MKTILVGVDGSQTAARAATTAAQLATWTGAQLHVVTAFGNTRVEAALKGAAEQWQAATSSTAQGTVDEVAEGLRRQFPELTISSLAVDGKPHAVLVDEAERLDADLIVVGNRGMQGVQRVLGSVADAVAHRAPCDVYIAHTAT